MGKELKRMAGAFLEGVSSFASFPTAPAPRRPPRRPPRGVGRHFAAVGARMRLAAERLEAAGRG
jgi:hypothetical protein